MSTDGTRKTPTRNMRMWITDLDSPQHAALWKPLVGALRDDRTPEAAWGPAWDRIFCRFMLGKLITDDNQSRQAVNNAIKRELDTPVESRSSSKSKTFRDLFREQCRAGRVQLPKLEQPPLPGPVPYPSSAASRQTPIAPSLHLPHIAPAAESGEPHSLYAASPVGPRAYPDMTYINLKKRRLSDQRTPLPTSNAVVLPLQDALLRYRDSCRTDEWGRTAWWNLAINDINKLPLWLAHDYTYLFELRNLLLDFRWIRRTFECADSETMHQVSTSSYDLLLDIPKTDPGRLPAIEVEAFRLIRNALKLITPILASDSIVNPKDDTFIAHLATQLVGRLLSLKTRFPLIACLIQSIELHAPKPWLRPLNPCFQEPGTDIKMAVPSNGTLTPHLIALSPDGALLAVSGTRKVPSVISAKETERKPYTSLSSTVKKLKAITEGRSTARKVSSICIWDVETGRLVCRVERIENLVRCLAITPDHSCVIAETVDGLFFWKLEKLSDGYRAGKAVEATPRPNPVTSMMPTVRTRELLTTSRSGGDESMHTGTIALWNTDTGERVRTFDCVTSQATCTDVSLDGEYFASGHNNGYIHLWTLHGSETEPVLSFKNEGAVAENGQQHVALDKVNRTRSNGTLKTISLSFYGKEEQRWLAAVSANEIIRVWELPPGSIIRKGKESFVTTIRRAVLRCPRVRQVQWSKCGWFFSAGDDGIARMWMQREEGGRWVDHALGRKKRERASDISSVLVSSGRGTKLVATYVTKSPYVTVWDLSGFDGGNASQVARRQRLYRSYMCMVPDSEDARDIEHLTALRKTSTGVSGKSGVGNGGLEGMADAEIRRELEKRFHKLDIKNATKLVGEMHPRLKMKPEEWRRGLEVCFEQPVIVGVSGTFRRGEREDGGKIGVDPAAVHAAGIPGELAGERGGEYEEGRRGMVAALQDGAIAMFELEGGEMALGKQEMQVEPKMEIKVIGGGEMSAGSMAASEECKVTRGLRV
ncbi:WD40-repeat containing protein [Chondrus crispus]|uniref:WD40-repeat containing protein n=1 Tax=Chondrus crispus TaxID=2769 RepID=R7QKS7_CHOCR|nr:WD40-repeat containing protein [Chondrus crispus]CDF37975.1 WD40-repeat containing protein [Chondrus crispus]|eukprot:XP_005717844.1 WD40-repeat containing protein [Chondrus crispus]